MENIFSFHSNKFAFPMQQTHLNEHFLRTEILLTHMSNTSNLIQVENEDLDKSREKTHKNTTSPTY